MSKTTALDKTHSSSLWSALFIAANIGLPHLFHLIPGGGVMFLPIYFFTAFAAVRYGQWSGILTAVMSPLLGYLIFDAPKAFMIPDMVLKGVLLSVVMAHLVSRAATIQHKIVAVPVAVVAAWGVAGLLELPFSTGEIAFQDFFTGIPGMVMMAIAGWMALFFNKRMAG